MTQATTTNTNLLRRTYPAAVRAALHFEKRIGLRPHFARPHFAMAMTNFAFVFEIKRPWMLTTQKEITHQDIPEGILLLELDAALMTNLEDLYREFAATFKFPDYFGKNFNALDECITDLEWLPSDGYLLVIKNAEALLSNELDDKLESLLSILDSAGNEWATPIVQGEAWDREGVPFHTILELNKKDAPSFQLKLKKLGLEIDSL